MRAFQLSLRQTTEMKLLTAAFFGSVFMFLGVALGALGSHALSGKITQEALQSYMISIRYMLFHGLALLFLSAFPFIEVPQKERIALLLVIGVFIFSGSILLLSTKAIHGLNISWLGPVTPIGGMLLLGAWAYVSFLLGKAIFA
jgi:uncharacterized membrane protein YgdD (TMEM256/DUF423 family)